MKVTEIGLDLIKIVIIVISKEVIKLLFKYQLIKSLDIKFKELKGL